VIGDTSAKYAPVKRRFGGVGWKPIPDFGMYLAEYLTMTGLWTMFFRVLVFVPAIASGERTVAGFSRDPRLLFVGLRLDVDFDEKQQG
jgi:hypothetical protein